MTRLLSLLNTGLNAGVILMNLTRMRHFNFQQRAMAAQTLYDGKIELADQDILNIIFHGFPGSIKDSGIHFAPSINYNLPMRLTSERLHQLPCSFNFNWVHCEGKKRDAVCYKENCFCNDTFTRGVQIFHGNSGTFVTKRPLPFANEVYKQFRKVSSSFDRTSSLPLSCLNEQPW